MLEFYSASTRTVNARRAIQECVEVALGDSPACSVVLLHAAMGHDLGALSAELRALVPGVRVLGASCCGVVGREGASESMKDVAMMAIRGPSTELAVAHVDGLYGHNSREKARQLAASLKAQCEGISMVYFMASGIDIADDDCIAGIEDAFGPDVTIFGATSSDNMRGIVSYQLVDGEVFEHAAFAIGFADPTLEVQTQASHGFVAVGEPMVVTRSEGCRIIELDGRPAWETYTSRLQLPRSATPTDTIPIGALAEVLPPALAAEYGSDHILRAVTRCDADGTMFYATTCPVGTKLWLTVRDEARIFADLERMMASLTDQIGEREIAAVFHADCMARGRFLFGRVIKEELISRMQHPLTKNGAVPPWLGMYGFGEFARLGGANAYHNYTTGLYILCRTPQNTAS